VNTLNGLPMAPEDPFGRGCGHDVRINSRISIREFAPDPYIGNKYGEIILIGKAIAEPAFWCSPLRGTEASTAECRFNPR